MHGTVAAIYPTLRIIEPGYRLCVIHNSEGLEQFDSAPAVIHFRLQGQDILQTPSGASGDTTDAAALKRYGTAPSRSAMRPCGHARRRYKPSLSTKLGGNGKAIRCYLKFWQTLRCILY